MQPQARFNQGRQTRSGRLKELCPLRGACGVLDPSAPSPARWSQL